MNLLLSIVVSPYDFSKTLSTRCYAHIVCLQLEYGLAINCFTISQLHALEEAQLTYIKRVCDARRKASTKLLLHLSRLPFMSEQVSILQTRLLFRSQHLPKDTLINRLISYIRCTREHQ